FLSPVLQQPISLGADYVVHSTTKYLNGHSDVVGGAVIAADASDAAALSAWSNITGVTGAPFDAYLTLRGLRTLFPRVIQQEKTARIVAAYLDDHPLVTAVHYPGLKSHSGYDIAQAQQKGPGAMLSFELAGGRDAVRRFVGAVGGFLLAESLGGVESLIAHPATMTHVSMNVEARKMAGISDSLLRLSVGLEGEEDLVAGLDRGFAALG
ncbi:PLP-dependent transferase, partial [Aurantimonas sp. C2-6-R+9]|uniref:PLP-dependent transferase n=1 Tax=Aurantimonas sp. C2-6-R+9 TaxID=3114365 RepID=UPI002E183787|nr:PLP-dependent transferase [Aurantimonas sp. C2-6-R+9]